MVSADSPIKTVADLKGKTITANALKGANELGANGVDTPDRRSLLTTNAGDTRSPASV